jgi:hypothetical protein
MIFIIYTVSTISLNILTLTENPSISSFDVFNIHYNDHEET